MRRGRSEDEIGPRRRDEYGARVIRLQFLPCHAAVTGATDAAEAPRAVVAPVLRQGRVAERGVEQTGFLRVAGDEVNVVILDHRTARPRCAAVLAAQETTDLNRGE